MEKMKKMMATVKTMKKCLALLLCALILCPAASLADAAKSYLYTFTPGEVLSGEGMENVRELLNAVRLEIVTQKMEQGTMAQVELLSNGEQAFSLRALDGANGTYAIDCSLTGDCTLVCDKEQLDDFLLNVVNMLADLNVLNEESKEKLSGLAERATTLLETALANAAEDGPDSGIDLRPYLKVVEGLASEAEVRELDGNDPECPGATLVSSYELRKDDLLELVDTALSKLDSIPVLSNELASGRLHIGEQVITDEFIRELFAHTYGKTTLDVYQNAEGKLLKLALRTPEAPGLITDPEFAKARGVEITIERTPVIFGSSSTLTTVKLIGMDGALLTVQLDKMVGGNVKPLSTNNVYEVGEMDSKQLWEVFHGLGLTIAKNAMNMILVLPRVVFDMVVGKLIK